MIRANHFYYDLHEALGSPKVLIGLVAIGGFFTLYISFEFVYLFVILFAMIIGSRGLIGRRCPKCDRALVESGAEPSKKDAFTIYINWVCPYDGYSEQEATKGDSGLFGVN
ncbi:MAG: hypothetical protein KDI79_10240 [Anaerolineae bacterium]|nr:hypothetical protein [Anaerolineae bacterium]